VAASQEGIALLQRAGINGVRHAHTSQPVVGDYGVVTAVSNDGSLPADFYEQFASVLAGHRVWERDTSGAPA
jgi:catalase